MQAELLMVKAFLLKMGVGVKSAPTPVSTKQLIDRHHLLTEELSEYLQAGDSGHSAEILDALVDLQYLLLGSVLLHGMQDVFEVAFRRVHEANMGKVPGINSRRRLVNSDAVKPTGWAPANLEDLV